MVNNVTINHTTIVNANNITVYRNAAVSGAVVAVKADRFGQGPVAAARIAQVPVQQLQPIHGALAVKPVAASLVGGAGRAAAPPPRETLSRPVVATRAPQIAAPALEVNRQGASPESRAVASAAPARIVSAPAHGPSSTPLARAPFGQNGSVQRVNEPPPPHFGDLRASVPGGESSPRPAAPRAASAGSVPHTAPAVQHANVPQPSFEKPASQPTARRELPGEPANRVYQRPTPRSVAPPPPPPSNAAHAGGKPSGPARADGKERHS